MYTDDHIGSEKKELVWLDNSYHVATQDYDKDIINEKNAVFHSKPFRRLSRICFKMTSSRLLYLNISVEALRTGRFAKRPCRIKS